MPYKTIVSAGLRKGRSLVASLLIVTLPYVAVMLCRGGVVLVLVVLGDSCKSWQDRITPAIQFTSRSTGSAESGSNKGGDSYNSNATSRRGYTKG